MNAETLISLDNVGKQFSKGLEHSHKTLGQELVALFLGLKPPPVTEDDPDAFWALQDICFEVKRGEVLGVIGHNGAGKTTLLRLLNGELRADCGDVTLRGRRSSLIDLTGGFSSSMSGRENIYFRGAHLGFDRDFLRAKEQEILDFAELGDFIDAPIKTYSSGMLLRLGFAVTVFAEPDVLLVDEILAVGDFLFQQKCMNRINQLRENSAVVMVSHGMSTIATFADRCLLLDRGRPVVLGKPIDVIDTYYRLEAEKERHGLRLSRSAPRFDASSIAAEASTGGPQESGASAEEASALPEEWPDFGELVEARQETAPLVCVEPETPEAPPPEAEEKAQVVGAVVAPWPSGGLTPDDLPSLARAAMHDFLRSEGGITDVRHTWLDAAGAPVEIVNGSDSLTLRIEFTAKRRLRRLVIGVPIWSEDGALVTAFGTHGRDITDVREPGPHCIELRIPVLRFNKGRYFPVVAIVDQNEFLYRWPTTPLIVGLSPEPMVWGVVTLDYEWVEPTGAREFAASPRAVGA